ncbi:unnamed protein product [Ixodes persulcatus]
MIGIRSGSGGGGVASIGNSPSKAISTVLCVGFGGAVACLGLLLGVVVSRAYFAVTAMAACVLLLLLCCRAREACHLRRPRYSMQAEPAPAAQAQAQRYSRVYNVPSPRDPVLPFAALQEGFDGRQHALSLSCIQNGGQCLDPASAFSGQRRNSAHWDRSECTRQPELYARNLMVLRVSVV